MKLSKIIYDCFDNDLHKKWVCEIPKTLNDYSITISNIEKEREFKTDYERLKHEYAFGHNESL